MPILAKKLMFVTTGWPEQFEKLLKKHLNIHKILTKALNAYGSALTVEKRFLQLLKILSEVAPSSSSSQLLTTFHRDQAFRSHDLDKIFVCHKSTISPWEPKHF